MKQIILIGFIALITACSQHATSDHHASLLESPSYHTGEISASDLLASYPAFASQYQSFQPAVADKARFESVKESIDILVLFGTWCHDSQREVPKLLKLVEQSKSISLRLFAVDIQKSDSQGVADRHQLKYTPTFIVLKNNTEIGRVVEKPTKSLAQDLLTIIQQ